MNQPRLFDIADDELLISVYQKQGRTLDDLPYTPEFQAIYAAMIGSGDAEEPLAAMSKSDLFHRLHNLRKAGRLPRLGKAVSSPPRISSDNETMLVGLVESAIGKLSLRDRLPFTDPFDQLVDQFNATAGLELEHHDVWRIIAKLAK